MKFFEGFLESDSGLSDEIYTWGTLLRFFLVYLPWSTKNLNYIFTVADIYLLKNFIVKEWIYMKKMNTFTFRSPFSLKIKDEYDGWYTLYENSFNKGLNNNYSKRSL